MIPKEFCWTKKIEVLDIIIREIKTLKNNRTNSGYFICNISEQHKIINHNRIEEFEIIFPELYTKLTAARIKYQGGDYGTSAFDANNYAGRLKLLSDLKTELLKVNPFQKEFSWAKKIDVLNKIIQEIENIQTNEPNKDSFICRIAERFDYISLSNYIYDNDSILAFKIVFPELYKMLEYNRTKKGYICISFLSYEHTKRIAALLKIKKQLITNK